MSAFPEYAVGRFRKRSARPRVISTYRVTIGWEKVVGKPFFTQDVAGRLFGEDVTLVTLRWRSVEHQVPVHSYGVRRNSR
jgi:hypothetical protein